MLASELIDELQKQIKMNGDLPVYRKDYTFTVSDVEIHFAEIEEEEDVSQRGTRIKILPKRILLYNEHFRFNS